MNKKIVIIFTTLSYLLLFACSAELPVCDSLEDIKKYDGEMVRLQGEFFEADAGKTLVTYLRLPDGMSVVYQYSSSDVVMKYQGKKIEVICRIFESYPPRDEPVQMLMAPHMTEIGDIRVLGQ